MCPRPTHLPRMVLNRDNRGRFRLASSRELSMYAPLTNPEQQEREVVPLPQSDPRGGSPSR